MRRNEVLESKIREFLEAELGKLIPAENGSITDKAFAIYALFQKDISFSNATNQLVTQGILERMKNPAILFSDAPRNSGIGQLSIECEFRRQLLNYLQNLVPEELRDSKEEAFKKALAKIQRIEGQFARGNSPFYSNRNLAYRAVCAILLFSIGVACEIIYATTSNGPAALAAGLVIMLGASIFGCHTLLLARRQKREFKLFVNPEQSESSPLIPSGSIQIGYLDTDLFSEERLMRVAVGKISRSFLNEDVTFFEEYNPTAPGPG